MKMAGRSLDESTEALLSSFDQINQEFQNGISELQSLRSNCDAEIKKREALQFNVQSLQLDNERLTKLYTESLTKLAYQIENRVSCQSLKEELKRVCDEHSRAELEYRNSIESKNRDHSIRTENLESQIREFQIHKLADAETINKLQTDLSLHRNHIESLSRRLDKVYVDMESKYYYEVQGLKDCLLVEQEEKRELNNRFQEMEKELIISRSKLVEQQQDTTSSRHVETLKQKIMKMRKENEVLRRQLDSSKEKQQYGEYKEEDVYRLKQRYIPSALPTKQSTREK